MKVNYELIATKIMLRIAHKADRVRVHSGVQIEPKYWNKTSKQVRSSHIKHKQINQKLQSQKQFIQHLWDNGQRDIRKIKQRIDQHGFDAVIHSDTHTVQYIELIMQDMKQNTARTYNTLIRKLQHYHLDLPINAWTKSDLFEFERKLKADGASINYVARLLKDLNTTLNKALLVDMITHDQQPFRLGYKIKKERKANIKLELEEVKQFKRAINRYPAVKVWFICFYSDGTRISDVLRWKQEDIHNGQLIFTESKTGKTKQVTITQALAELLNSYKHKGKYLLPYLDAVADNRSEQKKAEAAYGWMNKQLKQAADAVGIRKKITMHVARNTYSYLALKSGYDIVEIQKSLNHSSVQQTREYIGTLTDDLLVDKRKKLHGLI